MGVMHAAQAGEEAYVVFRIDAPRDITRVDYGGRLYNRAPESHIDFLHSFDGGKTWTAELFADQHRAALGRDPLRDGRGRSARHAVGPVQVPAEQLGGGPGRVQPLRGAHGGQPQAGRAPRSSRWKSPSTGASARRTTRWSNAATPSRDEAAAPLHDQRGRRGSSGGRLAADRRCGRPLAAVKPGYSDGSDVGGEKFVPRWVTYGKNLARGKPYTVSVPSTTQWGAGDPEGKKLTDGVVGPPYAGGTAPSFAACWNQGQDAGNHRRPRQAESCGAFRIQLGAGWPWWDALKGEVKDQVEVLTSPTARTYQQPGLLQLQPALEGPSGEPFLARRRDAARPSLRADPARARRGPLRAFQDHAGAHLDRQRGPGAGLHQVRAVRSASRPAG